jgi:hypothetical protein
VEGMPCIRRAAKAVTGLFQGIILFYLLAFDLLTHYRVRFISSTVGAS